MRIAADASDAFHRCSSIIVIVFIEERGEQFLPGGFSFAKIGKRQKSRILSVNLVGGC